MYIQGRTGPATSKKILEHILCSSVLRFIVVYMYATTIYDSNTAFQNEYGLMSIGVYGVNSVAGQVIKYGGGGQRWGCGGPEEGHALANVVTLYPAMVTYRRHVSVPDTRSKRYTGIFPHPER